MDARQEAPCQAHVLEDCRIVQEKCVFKVVASEGKGPMVTSYFLVWDATGKKYADLSTASEYNDLIQERAIVVDELNSAFELLRIYQEEYKYERKAVVNYGMVIRGCKNDVVNFSKILYILDMQIERCKPKH